MQFLGLEPVALVREVDAVAGDPVPQRVTAPGRGQGGHACVGPVGDVLVEAVEVGLEGDRDETAPLEVREDAGQRDGLRESHRGMVDCDAEGVGALLPSRGEVGMAMGWVAPGPPVDDASPDPAIVTQWIAETQTERAAAVAALDRARQPSPPRRRMTRQEIKDLIDALGGLLTVLGKADPEDKAKVYQQLGLRLTYDHETQTVLAEAAPRSSVCVVSVSEGGLGQYAHALQRRHRLVLG